MILNDSICGVGILFGLQLSLKFSLLNMRCNGQVETARPALLACVLFYPRSLYGAARPAWQMVWQPIFQSHVSTYLVYYFYCISDVLLAHYPLAMAAVRLQGAPRLVFPWPLAPPTSS